jgi:hypothetical protein
VWPSIPREQYNTELPHHWSHKHILITSCTVGESITQLWHSTSSSRFTNEHNDVSLKTDNSWLCCTVYYTIHWQVHIRIRWERPATQCSSSTNKYEHSKHKYFSFDACTWLLHGHQTLTCDVLPASVYVSHTLHCCGVARLRVRRTETLVSIVGWTNEASRKGNILSHLPSFLPSFQPHRQAVQEWFPRKYRGQVMRLTHRLLMRLRTHAAIISRLSCTLTTWCFAKYVTSTYTGSTLFSSDPWIMRLNSNQWGCLDCTWQSNCELPPPKCRYQKNARSLV